MSDLAPIYNRNMKVGFDLQASLSRKNNVFNNSVRDVYVYRQKRRLVFNPDSVVLCLLAQKRENKQQNSNQGNNAHTKTKTTAEGLRL